VHLQARVIHGGGQHEITIGEPSSLAQKNLPLRKVDPLIADVSAPGGRLLDNDTIACARRKFLNHNRVAAGGHDAAGKNPSGLVGSDLSREGMAGCHFAYHFKCRWRLCDIGCAHRKSIHCRNCRWGLCAESGDIRGKDTTKGIVERYQFIRQGLRLGEHSLQRVGDRHQGHRL
jgi:hypothetical protein